MKDRFLLIIRGWKIAIKAEIQAYTILGVITLGIYVISLCF